MGFDLLVDGDTVGIVAPASYTKPERLAPAIDWLESCGYVVRVGQSVGPRDRFLAGNDAARAADVESMFADPDVKAIFAARGGYGSSRLLEQLDWEMISRNPKPFIGFSDTTALQLGLLQQTGMPSLSGLTLAFDASAGPPDEAISRDLNRILRDGMFEPVTGLRNDQTLSGRLVGGCLSLIVHLLGTSYMPDLGGSIILIEDVGEAPYRIDRMLTQLVLSGLLASAAGVAFGDFHDCDGDAEDGTVDEVLADFASRCPCPVVRCLPYGHGLPRSILPIGLRVLIDSGEMVAEEEWAG